MYYLNNIKIEFDEVSGINNGFFCFKCKIDDDVFYPQFCVDGSGPVDFQNCGYDWGISGDVNKLLADRMGWHCVLLLLEFAYLLYINNNEDSNNE